MFFQCYLLWKSGIGGVLGSGGFFLVFNFFELCLVRARGVMFCRVPFQHIACTYFFFYLFFHLSPSQAADLEFLPGAVFKKTVFLVIVHLRPQKAFKLIFNHYLSHFFLFFLSSFLDFNSFVYCPLLIFMLCSFFKSCQLLLNQILLSTQNIFLHLIFCSFTAQKYPMVHLLQKGDNSFNQELLKNMVKSIKMNDVYGPMSQILETLNKCPHFKRQR